MSVLMSRSMLLVPEKLAAVLPTAVQEQVALLEGALSHAEEGNPGRVPSGSYILQMLFWGFLPHGNHVLMCQKLSRGLSSQCVVSFYLQKSYCLCIAKYCGLLGSQNFSYLYCVAVLLLLLLAVAYKNLVIAAHIDVIGTIHK